MVLTVDLPPEVLRRLEGEAARRGVTADKLAADLIAQLVEGLHGEPGGAGTTRDDTDGFFGFLPFRKRGARVTNEIVEQLRDELLA